MSAITPREHLMIDRCELVLISAMGRMCSQFVETKRVENIRVVAIISWICRDCAVCGDTDRTPFQLDLSILERYIFSEFADGSNCKVQR